MCLDEQGSPGATAISNQEDKDKDKTMKESSI